MSEVRIGWAAAVAGTTIVLLLVVFFGVADLVSTLLGLPVTISPPFALRVEGVSLLLAGAALAGLTFRNRRPSAMLVSTYLTFAKLFGRRPIVERSGRTEQLVIAGAQRYTRNPLYFGVILAVFGLAFVGGYTYVLVAALIVSLWFRFILIPFEEKELAALFGEQYAEYKGRVPMLVPFVHWKRRTSG